MDDTLGKITVKHNPTHDQPYSNLQPEPPPSEERRSPHRRRPGIAAPAPPAAAEGAALPPGTYFSPPVISFNSRVYYYIALFNSFLPITEGFYRAKPL